MYMCIFVSQCLDIYPATRHLQATTETKVVSQFIQQLVYYKEQWMFGLINQHNCIIVSALCTVSVCTCTYIVHVILHVLGENCSFVKWFCCSSKQRKNQRLDKGKCTCIEYMYTCTFVFVVFHVHM